MRRHQINPYSSLQLFFAEDTLLLKLGVPPLVQLYTLNDNEPAQRWEKASQRISFKLHLFQYSRQSTTTQLIF